MSSISYVVATLNRPTLLTTLKSIETLPGDEIIVIGNVKDAQHGSTRYIPHPPGGDWGHTERNTAIRLCRCEYIAHIDDDDVYAPGTRRVFEAATSYTPGAPIIFRMRFPNGITLWNQTQIQCGNVGTPMFLMPNVPEKFGMWGSFVGGDCHFLETSKWKHEEYVWRTEIIAHLGHNV